jgi:hypothetical protein
MTLSADWSIDHPESDYPFDVQNCPVCTKILAKTGRGELGTIYWRAARLWNIDDDGTSSHSWNLTYNLTPMLKAAGFMGWSSFVELDTTMAAKHMSAVLHQLLIHRERYVEMEPPLQPGEISPWGTYDGLVSTLCDFLKVAGTHPGMPLSAWL